MLATALFVHGVTELDGKVYVQAEATFNDKVVVSDHNDNDTALQATNTNGGASARALKTDGMTELDGKVTVPDQNFNGAAVEVTNTNAGANARALKINGRTETNGVLETKGQIIANDDISTNEGSLETATIKYVNDFEPPD